MCKSRKDGGWKIDAPDQNKGYGQECLKTNTFWGYKHKSEVGSVETTFQGSGKATLNFGNCYEGGTTKVFLNEREIGKAGRYEYPEVSFNFKKGDTLKLIEVDSGIIKINSLDIEGCELNGIALLQFSNRLILYLLIQ